MAAAQRATRSKNGCFTCRKRKLKCDETHPICKRCTADHFSCDWPVSCPSKNAASPTRSKDKNNKTRLPLLEPRARSDTGLQFQNARQVSIGLSPKDQQLELANSMTIAARDRRFLEYFPSTTLYCIYNGGNWSLMQYLVRELAPSSIGVTRMMLAMSASEMHRKGLGMGARAAQEAMDSGLQHYNLALKHLSDSLLGEETGGGGESVEALIATIFFMVNYEIHFSNTADRAMAHLRGLWALVSKHPVFHGQEGDAKLSLVPRNTRAEASVYLSCQLILWLLHADISGTSNGATQSLLELLNGSDNPNLQLARVSSLARLGRGRIWGDKYPQGQLLTDMALHRPLEFGHQILALRYHIWALRTSGGPHLSDGTTAESLLDQLLHLGETYSDVLLLADETAAVPWSADIDSITGVCASYWACILFHRRVLGAPGPQETLHEEAVAKIVKMLYYRSEWETDRRRQVRVIWVVFMAAIETPDPIHRDWLLERLRVTRNETVECKALCAAAEQMLSIQTVPGIPWVDLGAYMQPQVKSSPVG
ncbi:hypothetical protein GQ53DRAFT_817576 [Thozetella sp. PMI_491]|nr:hypothetical protein GQ53DRAFT_817576 [Thozetella sp. PMI_491]